MASFARDAFRETLVGLSTRRVLLESSVEFDSRRFICPAFAIRVKCRRSRMFPLYIRMEFTDIREDGNRKSPLHQYF